MRLECLASRELLSGGAEGPPTCWHQGNVGGPNVMALYEGLPSRSGEEWFEMACCHAALAGAAGRERSGIPAGDGESEAGKATTLLRKAVAVGYRNTDAMTKESDLDPLRNRPDFKLLMLDLAFPADPFAR